MIKELWILVKMLFASNPKEIGKTEVMDMQHFPSRVTRQCLGVEQSFIV